MPAPIVGPGLSICSQSCPRHGNTPGTASRAVRAPRYHSLHDWFGRTVTDDLIRDPAEIRADCARKLKPIETGGMFGALLAALLDEDWTTPKIEQLFIMSDRCILARPTGEVTHKIQIQGVSPISAAHNAVGLAGESPAVEIDCLST